MFGLFQFYANSKTAAVGFLVDVFGGCVRAFLLHV